MANYRAKKQLDLVHTDLCGQIRPKIPSGKNYFLLIVDDYSRYMWIELLIAKDEALKCFKRVKTMAETEYGGKLRAFRSDRGGELPKVSGRATPDQVPVQINPHHQDKQLSLQHHPLEVQWI